MVDAWSMTTQTLQTLLDVHRWHAECDGTDYGDYITIHTDAGDAVIAVDELGDLAAAIAAALGD